MPNTPSIEGLRPLRAGDVHIWRFSGERTSARARASVSPLLAAYLRRPIEDLRFNVSRTGKPALLDVRQHRLHYNVSHTEGLSVIAVTLGLAIGIDVEQLRPVHASWRTAKRLFSGAEAAYFRDEPADISSAWFKCWVSREAYLKGLGAGFTIDPRRLECCPIPGLAPRLVQPHPLVTAQQPWQLFSLDVGPRHIGILASTASAVRLLWFEGNAAAGASR